jgi:hypothetical protein
MLLELMLIKLSWGKAIPPNLQVLEDLVYIKSYE